jgi:hypothetical protein
VNDSDFRWRSNEIMRIEGLSDGVFAFVVTLLVVSLEVPTSYADLTRAMLGFPAFGACFLLLLMIWWAQHIWFRRYGLQDARAVVLNCALLFLVLLYAYPLKFLWTFLFDQLLGLRPDVNPGAITSAAQMRWLMVVYALGFIAIFGIFVLLYRHAWNQRTALGLDENERFATAGYVQFYLIFVGVGLLSLAIALLGGDRMLGVAGFSYGLIGPALGVHGYLRGKKRQAQLAGVT